MSTGPHARVLETTFQKLSLTAQVLLQSCGRWKGLQPTNSCLSSCSRSWELSSYKVQTLSRGPVSSFSLSPDLSPPPVGSLSPSTQASLLFFRLSSSLLLGGGGEVCTGFSFHLECSAGQPSPTVESWVPRLLLRGFPLLLFSFCNPMDYSTPSFSVLHYLQGFAQIHVHWVSDAI